MNVMLHGPHWELVPVKTCAELAACKSGLLARAPKSSARCKIQLSAVNMPLSLPFALTAWSTKLSKPAAAGGHAAFSSCAFSRPRSSMQGRLCRGEATGSHAGCWADVRAAAKATGGGEGTARQQKQLCACLVPMPVPAYRKRVAGARQKQQAKQQPGGSSGRHPCSSVGGVAGAAEAQLKSTTSSYVQEVRLHLWHPDGFPVGVEHMRTACAAGPAGSV